jgi:hypothetical protein
MVLLDCRLGGGKVGYYNRIVFQGFSHSMAVALHRSIDDVRLVASDRLDPERRAELGQFMTPSQIADFMASLFRRWPSNIRLLDPGAGVGSLTDAFFTRWSREAGKGARLDVTAYEIDPVLQRFLKRQLGELAEAGVRSRRFIQADIIGSDFIKEAVFALGFGGPRFTHVILNPPYKKIGAASEWRCLLRSIGVETVNLYTAFLALAVALTENGGEIVAIVPRSFCNGTYFRPFRQWLLDRVALTHIHVFESRRRAFEDDDVLQENIIVRLQKGAVQNAVTVSTSHDPSLGDYSERVLDFSDIVKPGDEQRFIHIPTGAEHSDHKLFCFTLAELGLGVATGPVVDFRLKEHCLPQPAKNSVPLLYAQHFSKGAFQWPREHRKPNAILVNDETRKWLMPKGWYALTKRFSSKEEKRRVVSYVLGPEALPYDLYGIENHLNVIHSEKRGLDEKLARGLSVFLNSTLVDSHFRTFSGHTQVNATDLRAMRFPSKEILIRFGAWAKEKGPLSQEAIDSLITSDHGD